LFALPALYPSLRHAFLYVLQNRTRIPSVGFVDEDNFSVGRLKIVTAGKIIKIWQFVQYPIIMKLNSNYHNIMPS